MIGRSQLVVTVALVTSAFPVADLVAQEVDWSTPPDVERPSRFVPPAVHVYRLSNGLAVYLVRRGDVPLVQVNVVMRTGTVHEPPHKAGLAQLTASLMRSDAGARTSEEISQELQFLGAQLGTQVTAHSIEAHLLTPLSSLDGALELLADAVIRPRFSETAFENLQPRWAEALARRANNRVDVANLLFRRALFGDHAYGRFPSGTAEGMRAIEVGDVRAFHRLAAHPARSALVVVGAVEMADLIGRLEPLFGVRWPGDGDPSLNTLPPPAPSPGLYVVNAAGTEQSIIRIAQQAPERTSPDYHAFLVLNFVLGGSTTSRLGAELRETLAITYEARSDFTSGAQGGTLVAWANVQTDATATAAVSILRQLDRLKEKIAPDEVAIARGSLTMSFPEPFMTIAGTAGVVGELVALNLPMETLQEYHDQIQSVAVEDVVRVAREHVDSERLVRVIVGDLERIRGSLVSMGLGTAVELTAEEALRFSPSDPAR